MRKIGWILVGLILFVSLGNGIRLAYRARREQEAVEQAYRTLNSLCSKGTPIPAVNGLDGRLEVLLRDPLGHPLLRKLAAEFPSVAFHERRNAVFYLCRTRNPDGTDETSFSSYASVLKGPQRGQNSKGSRFPPSMLFRKVAIEGERVVVEFEIPKTEKKPTVYDTYSFEPGTTYVTRMEAEVLLNPDEPATGVYTEFFPKAMKK